jgi:alkylation response protein AidB-like acyl-CoA dehydrogenase
VDFSLSDDQQALFRLADTILAERCPAEVLRDLEAADDRLCAPAWRALAEADLLGLALPTAVGGSGLGLVDAALVAEQVGRHVALVPYWSSTAAALTVAHWGGSAQRRWLPGAADGTAPLTVAPWEPGTHGLATRPAVTAVPLGGDAGPDGWRLDGTKQPVPWARHAAAVVVPAAVGESDVGLFLVPLGGAPAGSDLPAGATLVDESTLSREPFQTLVLDGVRLGPDALVGTVADGHEALRWLVERATALLCATGLGVVEGALALTSGHVSERRQFGAPIGTFQAVAQRSADAYVDTEAIRLTTWRATWQLDAGVPAGEALDVASFWVAEGGHRVVHTAQHLHGGIGVDTDYPVHRFFRRAKVLELLLGGAPGSLARLGTSLAGVAG